MQTFTKEEILSALQSELEITNIKDTSSNLRFKYEIATY